MDCDRGGFFFGPHKMDCGPHWLESSNLTLLWFSALRITQNGSAATLSSVRTAQNLVQPHCLLAWKSCSLNLLVRTAQSGVRPHWAYFAWACLVFGTCASFTSFELIFDILSLCWENLAGKNAGEKRWWSCQRGATRTRWPYCFNCPSRERIRFSSTYGLLSNLKWLYWISHSILGILPWWLRSSFLSSYHLTLKKF